MDLARVHKKISEAGFFLGRMTEEERRVGGDEREPFDYYLSAFLSASMSVREPPAQRSYQSVAHAMGKQPQPGGKQPLQIHAQGQGCRNSQHRL
jgi:hypothetical protein